MILYNKLSHCLDAGLSSYSRNAWANSPFQFRCAPAADKLISLLGESTGPRLLVGVEAAVLYYMWIKHPNCTSERFWICSRMTASLMLLYSGERGSNLSAGLHLNANSLVKLKPIQRPPSSPCHAIDGSINSFSPHYYSIHSSSSGWCYKWCRCESFLIKNMY